METILATLSRVARASALPLAARRPSRMRSSAHSISSTDRCGWTQFRKSCCGLGLDWVRSETPPRPIENLKPTISVDVDLRRCGRPERVRNMLHRESELLVIGSARQHILAEPRIEPIFGYVHREKRVALFWQVVEQREAK